MSTQELTLVNDVPLPLAKAEALNGLAVDSSASLIKSFAPHFTSFYSLVNEANAISEDEPNAAKAMRLKIVKIRTGADRTRSALKTEGLRIGKAIDGINHLLLNDLTPVETRLDNIEKREARLAAARITALAETRKAELIAYQDPTFFDLGNMPETQWTTLIENAKAAHEAKLAAAAKAEAERLDALKKAEEARLAKEAADKAERDKLAAENAKLAAQAEEARKAREAAEKEAKKLADAQKAKDAKIAAERAAEAKALADKAAKEKALRDAEQAKKDAEAEKARKDAEAKIKAEKDRADALEAKVKADAQAKIDAENKAKADAKKAADKAAKAPDRAKVEELASKLSEFKAPALKSEAGVALAAQIDAQLAKFVKWLNAEAGKL